MDILGRPIDKRIHVKKPEVVSSGQKNLSPALGDGFKHTGLSKDVIKNLKKAKDFGRVLIDNMDFK